MPAKKFTDKQKQKLDSESVPDLNLKKAEKLYKQGKYKEADEAYNEFKKGVGRFKD